jgi:predicted ribosomally synthesized peptide with SipW-like signal peptide
MKKLLFVLMACVLSIGLIGGAFAYFTDVETSTGNSFQAGTLNIQISDEDEAFGDAAVTASYVSPAGWAPGQEFTTNPVYLNNVGSIAIERIYARFGSYTQVDGTVVDPEMSSPLNNIGGFIKLVSYSESNDGGATWYEESFTVANANDYLNFWIARGASFTADGVISLSDLVEASNHGSGDMVTALCLFDGGNAPGDPPLPTGDTAGFKFKFQLLPETLNYYQGDIATVTVQFIAAQIDTYPDDLLNDSITEPLVPAP